MCNGPFKNKSLTLITCHSCKYCINKWLKLIYGINGWTWLVKNHNTERTTRKAS